MAPIVYVSKSKPPQPFCTNLNLVYNEYIFAIFVT